MGNLTGQGRSFELTKKPGSMLNPLHAASAPTPTPASLSASASAATSAPALVPEETEVPFTTSPLPGVPPTPLLSPGGGYVLVNPLSQFSKTQRTLTAPGLVDSVASYTEVNLSKVPDLNPGFNVTNPSIVKETELFNCIKTKNKECILKLLREEVNINTTNFINTPLIYAILATNSVKIIELLLVNGANVNQRGYNNVTPLIAVCSTVADGGYFMKDIFDKLMEFITANYEGQERAEIINYQPIYGNNPSKGMNALMMACHHGLDHVVDRLIANGADVNLLEDNVNESPLYIAVFEAINKKTENYKRIIELLVRAGADCSMGKSPLTLPVTADLEGLLSSCGKSSAGGSSRKNKNKNRKYKNRKNKSRKATRKSRRASRKSRRASRKSRKNRKATRKN
jgi:ankyrin repeat protein